ncbi:unnamed protein product [Schistosoma curassoni]|nr:unnamed protein product [Schistosoma curassoni]
MTIKFKLSYHLLQLYCLSCISCAFHLLMLLICYVCWVLQVFVQLLQPYNITFIFKKFVITQVLVSITTKTCD